MKQLTASFPFTAAADLEGRTIAGTLVPYGEVGYSSVGSTRIEAGALTVAEKVVLLVSHDHDRPIGVLSSYEMTDTGITGSFSIPATARGDEALLEAAEGLRTGLSVGVHIKDYAIEDDVYVVKAGTVYETSLVTFPAFESARVAKVAASEAQPETPETPEATPVVEDNPEGDTVDESTAVVEAAATPVALPRVRVQDAFPYRPGVQASFFGDLLNERHDVEASHRLSVARQMMTAAQVSTDVADIIPEGYRPDLYVGELGVNRPVIDSFQNFSIADAKPFRIPVFVSATDMLADHVEGTNPGDGSLEFDNVMVTPKAVSGQYTVSREVIDGSVPGVDQIILNSIRQAYATESETYAATTILTGATAGTDITTTIGLRANHAAFQAARKASADFLLLGTALFPALAAEVDGSDRPMNPYVNPSNGFGAVTRGAAQLAVDGYTTPLAWSIAGGLLGMRTDAAVWESGLSTWRWEEVDGPANIRFAAFGYIAAAVLRPAGVVKFSLDAGV